MYILLEVLQRAQHHGVILHKRETCYRADKKGPLRNTPTAAARAARLDGDLIKGALLEEIRQLKDARRRHALFLCQQPYTERTVGDHAVRAPIAPTIERYETRSRGRIEPPATRDD